MPIEFDAYLLDDRGELISHAASGLVLDAGQVRRIDEIVSPVVYSHPAH